MIAPSEIIRMGKERKLNWGIGIAWETHFPVFCVLAIASSDYRACDASVTATSPASMIEAGCPLLRIPLPNPQSRPFSYSIPNFFSL